LLLEMTSTSNADSTSAVREAQRRAQEQAAKQAADSAQQARQPVHGARSEAAVEEQQRRNHDVAGHAAVNEVKGEAGKALISEPKREMAPALPSVAADAKGPKTDRAIEHTRQTHAKGPQTDRAIEHARQAQVIADNKQVSGNPIKVPGGNAVSSEQQFGLQDPGTRADAARKIADDAAKDGAMRSGFSGQQQAAETFYSQQTAADKAKLTGTEKPPATLRDAMLNKDGSVNTNAIKRTVDAMQQQGHDISAAGGSWAHGVDRARNDAENSLQQQAAAKFQNTKDNTPIGDTMLGKAVAAFGETAYGRYTKGGIDAVVDAAVGIKDMAIGAANLTGINGDEAKKGTQDTLAKVGHAMVTDPVGVAKEIVKPVTERWEKGDYAGAIGYGVTSVAASVLGGKGLDKAATLVRGGGVAAQVATKGDDVVVAATRLAASKVDDVAKKADGPQSPTKAADVVDPNSPVQKKLAELEATKPDPLALEKKTPDTRDAGRIDRADQRIQHGYDDLTSKEYGRVRNHAERVANVDAVAAKYGDVIKELPMPLRDALLGAERFDPKLAAAGRMDGAGVRSGGIRNSIPSPDDVAGALKEARGKVIPDNNKLRPYRHDIDVESQRRSLLKFDGAIHEAEKIVKQYTKPNGDSKLSSVQLEAVGAYLKAAKEAAVHASPPAPSAAFATERAAELARINAARAAQGKPAIGPGSAGTFDWATGQMKP
jgi:hypothetical protein